MKRFWTGFLMVALCSVYAGSGSAQTGSAAQAGASKTAASMAKTTAGVPTDAQISDAQSKGMVWANKESKVYHKGGQFYGKTKHGQFMTEADAQKAGYKEAKSSPVGKKKATAGQ